MTLMYIDNDSTAGMSGNFHTENWVACPQKFVRWAVWSAMILRTGVFLQTSSLSKYCEYRCHNWRPLYTAHTCHQSIMKTPPDGVENAAASDSSCMFTPVLVSPISAAVAASAGRFCGVSIRGSSRQCLHSVWSAAA